MHLKYDVDIVEPQRVCCSGWAAMVCGPSLWMLLALRDDDVGVSTSRKPESRFSDAHNEQDRQCPGRFEVKTGRLRREKW